MARLKCKDGDFALVIYDTPGCEQNIGKVVRVLGPATLVIKTQMMGWRIKPLFPLPGFVEKLDGQISSEFVEWDSCVYHEDEWLMPLRPPSPEEIWHDIQTEMDIYLVEIGAVVPLIMLSSRLGCHPLKEGAPVFW